MSLKHDIKAVMAKQGVSMNELNDRLNEANKTAYTVSNISQKINNETIRYTEVEQLLQLLDTGINWYAIGGEKE
jgi:hypothetical protein